MSRKLVVGLSGNLTRPSKTKAFVSHIAGEVASRAGAAFSDASTLRNLLRANSQ